MKKRLFIICVLALIVNTQSKVLADLISPQLIQRCSSGKTIVCSGKECDKYKNNPHYKPIGSKILYGRSANGLTHETGTIYCQITPEHHWWNVFNRGK